MKKIIGWIIGLCLLAGGATVCAIRWEAWFGNPPEPEWTGEKITHQFITMNNDSVLRTLQRDTLSFLLLGDIHNSLTNDQMAALSERHSDIQFWAQMGDWMERPYFYYEQMVYQSLLDTRLDSLPIVAIPGNHEYLKGVVKTLPEHWKTIFHLKVGRLPVIASILSRTQSLLLERLSTITTSFPVLISSTTV